jgi:hypothetical protein
MDVNGLLMTAVLCGLACLAACAQVAAAEADEFPVTDYGAVGDGTTLNTAAIQAAIDACAAAGGGTVRIPAGRFLTGTLFMKSGVRLHLGMGAVLLGSTDRADYPLTLCAYPSRSDAYTARALLWGEGLRDIAITGHGTLDGQGAAFEGKVATEEELAEITRALEAQGRHAPEPRYYNRPYLIRFISCTHVRVEDVRMRDSAMWMQQYLNCEFVTVRGIHVVNHVAHNNDMIDIDGCRFVIISDCFGDTSDDALTLKSTGAAATEHVVITNCILSSHCNGLKMGTESAGGFRDIAISNCVIKRSDAPEVIAGRAEGLGGIALEIVDGGTMERVTISNMTIEGYTAPIFLRLGNRARPPRAADPAPPVGRMRDISLANIVATGASPVGCAIAGLPGHPIENLTISGVRLGFQGGGDALPEDYAVPEEEARYPESTMFGALPAYGLYIRHARNIALTNVTLAYEAAEARPAVVCDDVAGLRISGLNAARGPGTPAVVLKDTVDAFIHGCPGAGGPDYLQALGTSGRVEVHPE